MFYPTKEVFKKKCRQGNLIPVAAEIMADLETPVSAFLKLNTGQSVNGIQSGTGIFIHIIMTSKVAGIMVDIDLFRILTGLQG